MHSKNTSIRRTTRSITPVVKQVLEQNIGYDDDKEQNPGDKEQMDVEGTGQ